MRKSERRLRWRENLLFSCIGSGSVEKCTSLCVMSRSRRLQRRRQNSNLFLNAQSRLFLHG